MHNLTKTELEILRRLADGKTNREISEEMHLVVGTVKNYIEVMFQKLQLKNRVQLAVYYLEHIKKQQ